MLHSLRSSRPFGESRRFQLEQLEDRVQPNDMFNLAGSALLGLDSGFLFRDPLATALHSSAAPQLAVVDMSGVAQVGPQLSSVAVAAQFVNVGDLQPAGASEPLEMSSQLGEVVGTLFTPSSGPVAGPGWMVNAEIPVVDGLSQSTATADDNGIVYSIGGGVGAGPSSRINQLLAYDPGKGSWSERAPIPIEDGIAAYGAAVHYAGTIYVFGGIHGVGATAGALNTLWKYDIASDSWSAGANLPGTRFGCAVAVINDQILVAGGSNGATAQDSTWAYDPATDAYSLLPSMPVSTASLRIHAATLADRGEVHVFAGGFDGRNHWVYDANTNEWRTAAIMPVGVTDPGAVSLGSQIYVLGGLGTGRAQIYDADTDTWSNGPNMPGPTNNTSAALSGSTIYVLGGFNGTTSIPVNYSLALA